MSSFRYRDAPLVVPQVIGPDGKPERVVRTVLAMLFWPRQSNTILDTCILFSSNPHHTQIIHFFLCFLSSSGQTPCHYGHAQDKGRRRRPSVQDYWHRDQHVAKSRYRSRQGEGQRMICAPSENGRAEEKRKEKKKGEYVLNGLASQLYLLLYRKGVLLCPPSPNPM